MSITSVQIQIPMMNTLQSLKNSKTMNLVQQGNLTVLMELCLNKGLIYNTSQFSFDLFEEHSGTIDANFGYSKRKLFVKANRRKPRIICEGNKKASIYRMVMDFNYFLYYNGGDEEGTTHGLSIANSCSPGIVSC